MNRLPEHETAYKILDATRGRGKVWHRISLEGFRNVIKCGEIHANLDDRYESTYPQSKTCLARKLKAVSLFDFDSEKIEQIIEQECKWVHFFIDFNPVTIVMGFDRDSLPLHNLKYPSSLPREEIIETNADGVEYYPTRIPAVEIFCTTPINTKLITEIFVVKYGGGFIFEKIPFNKDTLFSVEKIKSEWVLEIEKEQERERNNPLSPINLLSLEDRLRE